MHLRQHICCTVTFIYLLLLPTLTLAQHQQAKTTPPQEQWLTSLAAATAAATSGKQPSTILIYFTTDNCEWCMRMEQGYLYTPEFIALAASQFTLVRLHIAADDFDSAAVDTRMNNSAADKEINTALQLQYHVSGFPTFVLTEADGTILGKHTAFGVTQQDLESDTDYQWRRNRVFIEMLSSMAKRTRYCKQKLQAKTDLPLAEVDRLLTEVIKNGIDPFLYEPYAKPAEKLITQSNDHELQERYQHTKVTNTLQWARAYVAYNDAQAVQAWLGQIEEAIVNTTNIINRLDLQFNYELKAIDMLLIANAIDTPTYLNQFNTLCHNIIALVETTIAADNKMDAFNKRQLEFYKYQTLWRLAGSRKELMQQALEYGDYVASLLQGDAFWIILTEELQRRRESIK